MPTLYEIGAHLRELDAVLADNDGEFTDDAAGRALEAWFDQLGEQRDAKIDGYCALIKEYEAKADAREIEAKRLLALAATDRNNVKRLKDRLKEFLQAQGLARLNTTRFNLVVAKNGGKPALLIPGEWEEYPENAPEAFQRRRIEIDRDAVRKELTWYESAIAELKAGKSEDEGAMAINEWLKNTPEARRVDELTHGCSLAEPGYHLRIR